MIITIDGPAGAGKSSVARCLADRLGYRFLDTGAMYRAVAWEVIRRQIDPHNWEGVGDLLEGLTIRLDGPRVVLNGDDVTDAIRTWEVTSLVAPVADNVRVRLKLVEWQREAAAEGDTITEGRDQGTVVFPHADVKFFLTASARERAKRRWADLKKRGHDDLTFEEVLRRQELRDKRDRSRPVGKLVPADDAIHINTDGMTLAEVVSQMEKLVPPAEPPR